MGCQRGMGCQLNIGFQLGMGGQLSMGWRRRPRRRKYIYRVFAASSSHHHQAIYRQAIDWEPQPASPSTLLCSSNTALGIRVSIDMLKVEGNSVCGGPLKIYKYFNQLSISQSGRNQRFTLLNLHMLDKLRGAPSFFDWLPNQKPISDKTVLHLICYINSDHHLNITLAHQDRVMGDLCWSYVPTTPFCSEHQVLIMSHFHFIPAIERLISSIHVSRPMYSEYWPLVLRASSATFSDGTDQDVYKRLLFPSLVVAVLIERSITYTSTTWRKS